MIGDHVQMMAGAHVAHDCVIAAHVMIAGQSGLAGHVEVGEAAIIGGAASIHQFCRIGARAMIGGGAAVEGDVIPYGSALGNRARLAGLNMVGLKRAGMSRGTIHALRRAFEALFLATEGVFADRIDQVAAAQCDCAEVMSVIGFLRAAQHRPIVGARRLG